MKKTEIKPGQVTIINDEEKAFPPEFIKVDTSEINEPASTFLEGITKHYHDPIYTDHKVLQQRIVKFFQRLQESNMKPTITGLVLYLGYSSRQSFYDMAEKSNYPLISYTIKRAKQLIENWYEYGLHDNKRVTGSIFALKNMGWFDNQKIDLGLKDLLKAPDLSSEDLQRHTANAINKL